MPVPLTLYHLAHRGEPCSQPTPAAGDNLTPGTSQLTGAPGTPPGDGGRRVVHVDGSAFFAGGGVAFASFTMHDNATRRFWYLSRHSVAIW